ncbi:glyoxylate/hydroxypyruvate reductase A [Ideonella sp. A 288]|uniref:2-hydroxyacid dehydrogenase n=1 Tax=Ideonella sp. A 288 TaxID=1962181 RepID=UPI000B4B5ADA|nr:glyoxylate/hydroxypyruvate reductase A [Ideonella sp. A 288]
MNLFLCGSWDDDERDAWAEALRRALGPGHRLLLQRGEVDEASIEVAIVANPPPGQLRGLTGLRLIQSLWAGVDRLLADATVPPEVPVARMVDPAMNAAMAETALWAVLSLHRGFFDCARQQRDGRWHQAPQRRADEVPVLVLGTGQMGRTAAARLAQQGYPVTAWGRTPSEPIGHGVRTVHGDAALAPALAAARTVVNLLPLTDATRGILDARLFSALPAGAAIVNLARGAHLVEADLLAALASGQIAHAVLDVFAVEPLPAGHPFWAHPHVTVLPHVAAQTDVRSAAEVVVRNVRALASGAPLAHRVDRARGY